jgi:hypothetical protein
MDTPTFSDDKPFAAVEALETEINSLVKEASSPNLPPQMQGSSPTLAPQIKNNDADRITSSVARLTSNSIQGLEGLKSELQNLQEFLSSEVGRVQQEIESALAGISIIVETIAPWKNMTSAAPPIIGRAVRSPANFEATQPRVGERGQAFKHV